MQCVCVQTERKREIERWDKKRDEGEERDKDRKRDRGKETKKQRQREERGERERRLTHQYPGV